MRKLLLGLIGLLFAVPAVATDLPSGYTELEYIESTGTQWIDTGYKPSNNTKVDITVSLASVVNGHIFGSRMTNTGGGGFAAATISNVFAFDYNGNRVAGISPTVGTVYRIVKNGAENQISYGTTVNTYSNSASTFSVDATMALFGINTAGTITSSAASIKIYSAQIEESGVLVRDFVPARRDSDGVIGMYDTVNNVFYTNQGTGTFIAGPEVQIKIATTVYNSARFSPVVTELNDTIATIRSVVTNTINQTKAIADLQATKQTRPDETCPAGKKCLLVEDDAGQPHWYEIIENLYGLPNGYTALEYIQSRGAQYINTGIYATQNTAIETRFINLNSDSTTSILIGNGWTGGKYQLSIVAQTGAPNRIGGLTNTLQNFWTTNTNFVVSMNKNGLYVNNSLKAWSGTLTEFNSNNANPLYLLGDPTASNRYTYAKLFYMKIYDDNVLLRNFVPAKRDSDGVIGLYDTVTYTFFTNAGTGTFIAGPEI